MQGLKLIRRTNSRRTWNLASYHSPHSLTWRWCLSLSLPEGDFGKWRPTFWKYRNNNGLQWAVGFLRCSLQWHVQPPMWYRDMYIRMRDERDRQAYDGYLMRSAQAEHGAEPEHRTIQ